MATFFVPGGDDFEDPRGREQFAEQLESHRGIGSLRLPAIGKSGSCPAVLQIRVSQGDAE